MKGDTRFVEKVCNSMIANGKSTGGSF